MGFRSLVNIDNTKKDDRIPSDWEQDVVEIYVNERQLVRPNTNIKTAFFSILSFLLALGVITWVVHYISVAGGIIANFPSGVQGFYTMYPVFSVVILGMIIFIIELFFFLKYAVIGAIKLYQHYAPEEIRRRCLFMPTCSEYAIMAVKKYGIVVGLWKSYFRLVYRCKGSMYQMDYP